MNEEEINRIFKTRYKKAVLYNRRFKYVYLICCLLIMGFGIRCRAYPVLPWVLVVLPALAFLVMQIKLFSRWTDKNVRKIFQRATEETTGIIVNLSGAFGLFQVDYKYTVNGKIHMSYDLINWEQFVALRKGYEVPVKYVKNKPKLGYLDI